MANRALRRSHARRRPRLIGQSLGCLLVLALAGSCTAPVIPPPAPPPRVTVRPTAPAPNPGPARMPPVAWQDMPIAPGEWRWASEGGQSTARFGPAGQTVALLACRNRAVALVRYGQAGATRPAPTVIIRTSSASRPNAATAQPGAVTLVLDARDPLLDAMAFSRGRFAIEVEGMAALALPSWPEVARVIDDCRA